MAEHGHINITVTSNIPPAPTPQDVIQVIDDYIRQLNAVKEGMSESGFDKEDIRIMTLQDLKARIYNKLKVF